MGLTSAAINSKGTIAQKERWVPELLTMEKIGAWAITEPNSGSDAFGSMKSTARRDGDEYVLNGSKTFITNGINADLVITAVKTDPSQRHKGMSLLVVERGMAGFERGRNLEKVGLHSQDTAELFFDDLRVPAANLVGKRGEGWAMANGSLAHERGEVGERRGALHGEEAVGQAVLEGLERADRPTELVAVLGVGHGGLEDRPAGGHGGQGERRGGLVEHPGEHVIGVTAEGYPTVTKTVVLPEKGGVVRVPIALEKQGGGGPSATGTAAATSASSATASASGAATGGPVEIAPRPYRIPAFVSFGVAGASIVVGAVTGALSLGMTSDLKARCPNDVCSPGDRGSLDSANALANASTATFVIGGAAAVAGVVLIALDVGSSRSNAQATGARLAKPGERVRAQPTPVQIEPWISAGGAGLRGRF